MPDCCISLSTVYCLQRELTHTALNFLCNYIHNIQKQRRSMKKSVLKNFVKSTGKHLCWSLIFNKTAGLRSQVSSCELWEIFKSTFLQNSSGRMPLKNLRKIKNLNSMQDNKKSIVSSFSFQKQPFADVLQNRCSWKLRNTCVEVPLY